MLTVISISSLIEFFQYEPTSKQLKVVFKSYFTDEITYLNVPALTFEEFASSDSHGRFYLNNIKNHFKQLKISHMADEEKKKRPKGINHARSDKKRFLKISLNVMEINKDWLHPGEKGAVYMNCTLHLMPDGTVDKFENLGFITQDVPKAIYSKDTTVKGKILGNAAEFEYEGSGAHTPGSETGAAMSPEIVDDLPF